MNFKYFLTILTGHSSRSSPSLPEKGSKAGIVKGAGSMPGMAVLAKKPGTTRMDMLVLEKTKSRGSRDNACNSLLLLEVAKANNNTVFQVHRILSCLVSHRGGSKSVDLSIRSTLDRSHSGTRGLVVGRAEAKALMSFDRQGCNDKGTPSTDPNVEAIDVL